MTIQSDDPLSVEIEKKVPLGELVEELPIAPDECVKPAKKWRPRKTLTENDERGKVVLDSLESVKARDRFTLKRDRSQLKQDEKDHEKFWAYRRNLAVVGVAVVISWQFAILWMVWRQGEGHLNIPSNVLLAVVTTTSFNVIGLLVIVFKFVFAAPGKANSQVRASRRKKPQS